MTRSYDRDTIEQNSGTPVNAEADTSTEPFPPLAGVWGLDRLERTGRPSGLLALWLVAASALIHLLLYLAFGGLVPGATFQHYLASFDFALVINGMGILTGIYLAVVLMGTRYTYKQFDRSLGVIDANTVRNEAVRGIRPAELAGFAAMLVFVVMLLYEKVLLAPLRLSLLDPRSMATQGAGFMAFFYLVIPVNAAAASLLGSLLFPLHRYLMYIVARIPIDLLRIDRYGCLSLPMTLVFCVMSGVVGVMGTIMVFADSPPVARLVLSIVVAMLVTGVVMMSYLALPLVRLHGRIVKCIDEERDMVLAAIDGHVEVVRQTRIKPLGDQVSQADLITHLMLLDSLDRWPIGRYTRMLVGFGIFPPIAWVLSAIVQNALS